jgi:hypothetical protein
MSCPWAFSSIFIASLFGVMLAPFFTCPFDSTPPNASLFGVMFAPFFTCSFDPTPPNASLFGVMHACSFLHLFFRSHAPERKPLRCYACSQLFGTRFPPASFLGGTGLRACKPAYLLNWLTLHRHQSAAGLPQSLGASVVCKTSVLSASQRIFECFSDGWMEWALSSASLPQVPYGASSE